MSRATRQLDHETNGTGQQGRHVFVEPGQNLCCDPRPHQAGAHRFYAAIIVTHGTLPSFLVTQISRRISHENHGFARAKTPRTPSSESFLLCSPFGLAQDMLCVFARYIPALVPILVEP
jgi:hypothetical protein